MPKQPWRTAVAALADCGRLIGFGLIGAAMLVTGCWRPDAANDVELRRGLVYMFPGVQAGPVLMRGAYDGLRDAGVERPIRIFEWQRVSLMLEDLTDYAGNRERAAAVADELAAYRRDYPDAPVDLVGYSGGGGMAIFVAEALPDDVRLRHIVLVHPALSPTYDLSKALRHVDGRVVNFHAPSDWAFLGFGTTVWGTMDREHTDSAGRVGFDPNAAIPNPSDRGKLDQRRWTADMLRHGHYGGHLPIMSREWNREFVGPVVVGLSDEGGERRGTEARRH